MKKKKKAPTTLSLDQWRKVALKLFPQEREFILSDDEEYGVYNLFFQLRGQFADAIAGGNTETATRILDFAGYCLNNKLASDGEDISGAAGVSLFEHIFEDCPEKLWPIIFSCMPIEAYHASKHYVEQWMDTVPYTKVTEAAKNYYTSKKRKS